MNSFMAEVQADSSGAWYTNALRFATEDEAKAYGRDLAGRWTLVTAWRVSPSPEPINYQRDGSRAMPVEDARVTKG